MKPLGKLERIDPRKVWTTEAQDFTPWLAQEENLSLLGEAIGIELEHEATEKSVGPFRADILCKDTVTGNWVLIENQLGRTDHDHLGKLLTYASGLNAVTIVWLAQPFTDEHRATLDWLNEIKDDSFNFFGLEIEVWRISDSAPAPKFNIVCKPNDWTSSVSKAARTLAKADLTDTKKTQLEYWTAFRAYLEEQGSSIRSQKPLPQHWATFSIGRTGFHLATTLNTREETIGVELYINHEDAEAFFNLLSQQKEEIEQEIGVSLLWAELPNRKGCRVSVQRHDSDPLNQSRWPEYMAWMKDHLERFDAAFRPRIRALDSDEWQVTTLHG
ncbi:MAG: DUF4268 domain-containing protein [Alphaproteobacteria bacterium]